MEHNSSNMEHNSSNANEILLHNILHATNNYITYSNNTINYLMTNSNAITALLFNNYNCYNNFLTNNTNTNNTNTNNTNTNTNNTNTNNTNTNTNNTNTNNTQNAYLLSYTLEDYENLSNVNIRALIKVCTAKINYCCIAVPLNDTCPITQDEFSSNDQVTIIKNCGHIFKTHAIKNWLHQHQTCPVCRFNILTNSKLISYINPDTNKKLFLYSNEFRFYLALHIENLLTNRDNTHGTSAMDDDTNDTNDTNANTNNEQNTYEFGLFLR